MITFEFHGFSSAVSQAVSGPLLYERAIRCKLPSQIAVSLDVSFINGSSQNRHGEKSPYIVVYNPDPKYSGLLSHLLRSIKELYGETAVKIKFVTVSEMEL